MRTKEDIEYDLRRMAEAAEQADKLLQILDNNTKMLNNITMAVDRLSDVIIELPPAPQLNPPPICSPEELERYKKLLAAVEEALKRR